MKKGFLLLIISFTVLANTASSQFISLSDTTITFKDQQGNILSREQLQKLVKTSFSIRQEMTNGKKVVTIIPSGNDERAALQAGIETFRSSLLNKPLIAFKLTDLDDKNWNSKELKDKVIVLNFWFTACKPCIAEMPLLNELVEANKNNNSVVFLAAAPENKDQLKKFLKKFNFDYHIIPSAGNYAGSLNIENFPTHLVIDKQGIIRQVFVGYSDDIKIKLQAEINKLITK